MDLKEYLFRNNLKCTVFGKMINYSHTYVNDIVNGNKSPGRKFALVVEKFTDGLVTVETLMNSKKTNNKSDESQNETHDKRQNDGIENGISQ